MNIFIYDVVNEEWIFRLDSNIRILRIVFISFADMGSRLY